MKEVNFRPHLMNTDTEQIICIIHHKTLLWGLTLMSTEIAQILYGEMTRIILSDLLILDKYNKVGKEAKIRNRYNQVPHLTQDTVRENDKTQENITYKRAKRSPFPIVTLAIPYQIKCFPFCEIKLILD